MRIARKTVYNKTTGERVFSSTWHNECTAFIAKQSDPSNYTICYHWYSI